MMLLYIFIELCLWAVHRLAHEQELHICRATYGLKSVSFAIPTYKPISYHIWLYGRQIRDRCMLTMHSVEQIDWRAFCIAQNSTAHAVLVHTIYELALFVIIRLALHIHAVRHPHSCEQNSIRIYDGEWYDWWKVIIFHLLYAAHRQRHRIKLIFNGNFSTLPSTWWQVFRLCSYWRCEIWSCHYDRNIEFLSAHSRPSNPKVTHDASTQSLMVSYDYWIRKKSLKNRLLTYILFIPLSVRMRSMRPW